MTIDLSKLDEPFDPADIKWRVSRAGLSKGKTYCYCLAYITARGIQARLDEVCGPENWRNEEPRVVEFQSGRYAFVCGISIRIGEEWITKWDVAEPTQERGGFAGTSAKGGFSGAMKRTGAQWGIRYLYRLSEMKAEVSETGGEDWNWATLPEKQGGGTYYWKAPRLPGWALPKDAEHEITLDDLNNLKRAWKNVFAADVKSPADLREGFSQFVVGVASKFPSSDYTCWTRDALERCLQRIEETTEPNGVDSDVPFQT